MRIEDILNKEDFTSILNNIRPMFAEVANRIELHDDSLRNLVVLHKATKWNDENQAELDKLRLQVRQLEWGIEILKGELKHLREGFSDSIESRTH